MKHNELHNFNYCLRKYPVFNYLQVNALALPKIFLMYELFFHGRGLQTFYGRCVTGTIERRKKKQLTLHSVLFWTTLFLQAAVIGNYCMFFASCHTVPILEKILTNRKDKQVRISRRKVLLSVILTYAMHSGCSRLTSDFQLHVNCT